jgi:predicted molibdopterin-dependent oxidoreductase YjgC
MYYKPMVSRPDDEVAESLITQLIDALEYSVVLAGHKSDWQARASAVLPVTLWSEESGTYTNYQGRVQQAGAALYADGDVMPAWEVFASLLYAGGDSRLWLSVDDVFAGIAESEPAFAGLTIDQTRLPGVLTN